MDLIMLDFVFGCHHSNLSRIFGTVTVSKSTPLALTFPIVSE